MRRRLRGPVGMLVQAMSVTVEDPENSMVQQ
jgi:hypothetical protein